MLTSLHISNYALIDSLQLELHGGLSVITGETGAGKSIILGALGLLQGNRADLKVIKAGAQKCIVEGVFTTEGLGVELLLQAADIDVEETLTVRREITATGKSRAFINDTPVNLSTLREVSALLIDIHSQHQNLLLSHETFLLDTLDCVAENAMLREEYVEAFRAYSETEQRLRELREAAQKSTEDEEYLRFQLAQIEDERFRVGEQEELEAESAKLSHAEEIKGAFYEATHTLHNDDYSVLIALRTAATALEGVARYMDNAEELSARLHTARIDIDDVLNEVERAADAVEVDPERLVWVDERLATIYRLQRKHHLESVEDLLGLADDLRQRLEAIDNADEHIAQAEQELLQRRRRLEECGQRLTQVRQQAAQEIVTHLVERLQNLGMPSVRLLFEFEHRTHPDRTGFDALRFLFSANKQVEPQDVATTASGGEIARLMLSLKALIAQKKSLPTIIFDEIDTGVSGTMAERMGRVMQEMGQWAQVICITHLPQIAALGQEHFHVYKRETNEGTHSHIDVLTPEARVQELANMLSGAQITEAALANARELLKS